MVRWVAGWSVMLAFAAGIAPAWASADEFSLYPASDGLEIGIGTQAQFLGFGAPAFEVLKNAEKLWGAPERTGRMEECGAGPIDYAEYENDVSLHFQESAFEGWFLHFEGTAKTRAGLGIGSTLAEVRAAIPGSIEVTDTTLGYEFWSKNLFGVISSPEDDGVVEALWSGIACIFR